MDQTKFIEEIRIILGAPIGVITPESRLAEFAAWDSMGKMALLTLIDDQFGLSVPAGSVQHWKTVGEVLEFVAPRLSK